MRIACLQFAPQVGDIDNNLNRADSVLSRANPKNLDLLVLPELAFSGYNFRSLQHITPYLEPTTSGITSLWARTTTLKHNCHVIVGYPEKVDVSPKWPASPEYYNSAITVNEDGETIANYRKSFLYHTDETWALEGPDGFYDGVIDGLGNVAMGICMDLNPYKFEAPWSAWEFAYHILHRQANLVVLSMAWLTREDARSYSREPKEPDMETLSYWLSRLEPLIRAEGEEEIICVFANRCGVEEEAVYAGTSAVLGIQSGEVKVYGILGRGEKELLVVDTSKRAQMQLISEPKAPTTKTPVPKPRAKSPTTGSEKPTSSTSPKSEPKKPSSPNSPKTGDAKSAVSSSSPKAPASTSSPTSSSSPKAPASISSTTSPVESRNSPTSALSLETDPSSLEPSIEACTFSPVSPVDHPFKQAFFGPPSPMPRPASRTVREREPTPVPKPFEPAPVVAEERYVTPAPHSRPASPKSRNASRSRGPTLMDSPPMAEDQPNEIRFSRSHFGNYWADSPVLEEFAQGVSPSPKYPQVSESNITQTVTLDLSHLNFDDPNCQIQILGQEEMDAEEKKATRISRAGSENSSQYESSFTRNTLGPRSRHMSTRPRSTQW